MWFLGSFFSPCLKLSGASFEVNDNCIPVLICSWNLPNKLLRCCTLLNSDYIHSGLRTNSCQKILCVLFENVSWLSSLCPVLFVHTGSYFWTPVAMILLLWATTLFSLYRDGGVLHMFLFPKLWLPSTECYLLSTSGLSFLFCDWNEFYAFQSHGISFSFHFQRKYV